MNARTWKKLGACLCAGTLAAVLCAGCASKASDDAAQPLVNGVTDRQEVGYCLYFGLTDKDTGKQELTMDEAKDIAIPLFIAGIALTCVDFAVIWRYFGWANQTMSCVTLWAIAVYLARRGRFHWIATLPAAFMTVVCVSYLCYAKIGFGMSVEMSTLIGIASAAASLVLFLSRGKRMPELENEASC